jgi:hypothetical protein
MTQAPRDQAWGGSGGGGAVVLPPTGDMNDFEIAGDLHVGGDLNVDGSFDLSITDLALSGNVTSDLRLDGDLLVKGGAPWFDVKAFGAVGDFSNDDTAAIQATIDAADAYAGGVGGAIINFPPGVYVTTASLNLRTKSGLTLRGAGKRSSTIRGNFNGPIIKADAAGPDPDILYTEISGLFLLNVNAGTAATALTADGWSAVLLRDCSFQSATTGSGTDTVSFTYTYNLTIEDCVFSGSGADHCLAGSTVNAVRITGSSFRDAKGGIYLVNPTATYIAGNHFEALAGSATDGFDGAICLRSALGGAVMGNYLEACNCSFFTGTAANLSRGFVIGGNFMTNPNTPAINMVGMTHSSVLSNYLMPGAYATNADIVLAAASTAVCTLDPQWISSGTGAASLAAATMQSIASAATITIPAGISATLVSGTTTITSITAGDPGRVVTLIFGGILTVTDGSNLVLAGNANFVTTNSDTLTLVSDHTSWYEIARSVN